MPLSDYITGLLFAAVVFGGVAWVTYRIVSRRLAHLRGAAAVCGAGIVATSVLLAVHLIPGVLGLLSRPAVSVATALLVLAVLAVPRTVARPREAVLNTAEPAWSRRLAVAGLALVGSAIGGFVVLHVTTPITHVDTVLSHLPAMGRWMQSGSLWTDVTFIPLVTASTYPSNGTVLMLSTVLPFGDDGFARLLPLPFLALTGIAVYAIARELSAPRSTAALAACAVISMGSVGDSAVEQATADIVLYATFAAGALFLLRYARSSSRSDLVLAGLGLGLSFGTKWFGVSSVVVVVAIWLVVSRRVRATAVLTGLIAAAGGFWLVRNWYTTGNPLFPVRLDFAGVTLLDAPPDVLRLRYGHTLFDRLGDWELWRSSILPELRVVLGLPAVVIGLGAVAALFAKGSQRVVALTALVLAAAYVVTPDTALGTEDATAPLLVGANARYLVPALLLAAAVTATAATRSPRLRLFVEVLLLAAVVDGVHQSYAVTAPRGALLIVLSLLAVLLAERGPRRRIRLSRWALVPISAMLAVAGHAVLQRAADGRYASDAALAWIDAHSEPPRDVGIAGAWTQDGAVPGPVRAAFGPRFHNRVEFVGSNPRGFILRHGSSTAFADGAAEKDVLVIGLAPPAGPRELRWARAAGFDERARSDRFVTLERE